MLLWFPTLIIPRSFFSEDYTRTPAEVTPASGDPVSFTRILCGALILPTIATIAGKAIFSDLRSNFQRSILVRSEEMYISNIRVCVTVHVCVYV